MLISRTGEEIGFFLEHPPRRLEILVVDHQPYRDHAEVGAAPVHLDVEQEAVDLLGLEPGLGEAGLEAV